jgi:hypothetical protein
MNVTKEICILINLESQQASLHLAVVDCLFTRCTSVPNIFSSIASGLMLWMTNILGLRWCSNHVFEIEKTKFMGYYPPILVQMGLLDHKSEIWFGIP